MRTPNEYRLTQRELGNNGLFQIPHHRISGYLYFCVISDGGGWEHVSVTLRSNEGRSTVSRCPTWEEMCYVKSLFWDDEESVMQLHPPKSMWVNNHPFCLHLWKPTGKEIPLPDMIMVGLPQLNTDANNTARRGTEQMFDDLLQRLKAKDKHFELRIEYGKLLMRHVNDLTPEEKARMKEIDEYIKANP